MIRLGSWSRRRWLVVAAFEGRTIALRGWDRITLRDVPQAVPKP